MNEDPHSILGVNQDASLEKIRQSYRRLALKLHPDRPGGDESRFKEIHEAYEQLMTVNQHASSTPNLFQNDPFHLFREMFRDMDGEPTTAAPNNPDTHGHVKEMVDLCFKIEISPSEMLHGCHKNVAVCRRRFCKLCQGRGVAGGMDQEIDLSCFQCRGAGVQTLCEKSYTPWQEKIKTTLCSLCHGEGINIPLSMEKCPSCRGNRLISEKAILSVEIPAGIHAGDQVVKEGEGNDALLVNQARGDLVLKVFYQLPRGWSRRGEHLIFQRHISLVDCVKREPFTFFLRLLSGDTVCLQIRHVVTPTFMLDRRPAALFALDNFGVGERKSGILFIVFQIDFPLDRDEDILGKSDDLCGPDSKIHQLRPASKTELATFGEIKNFLS